MRKTERQKDRKTNESSQITRQQRAEQKQLKNQLKLKAN